MAESEQSTDVLTMPDAELMDAIISASDAHTSMSKQALNSEAVRNGIKDILLNYAQLWEILRERAARDQGPTP